MNCDCQVKLTTKEFNDYGSSLNYQSSPNASSQDLITVYLYLPFYKIYRLIVDSKSCLSALKTVVSPNSILIYKGEIMDDKKTISKCNIQNETSIICISPKITEKCRYAVDKWMKISMTDDFNQKVKTCINKKFRLELARIKDMKSIRNESKRKRFGKSKLNSCFLLTPNNQIYISDDENKSINIDYEKKEEPSCEPLPILW